ncbi:MAG: pyruvate kinase [Clostridium argentinense]|uniref:Pyruvate kinase n=1 Tax=Clostridium faecium TaxID=2762223 RepID=A0ABR8YXA1_9CLOT|nr:MULTISPECIES: pyruvate kinase [Clostridium]MBD8048747.1 pyruvate kinase [Clostridium faecium]MBS5822453.1 pyruvate kinase [Clostridium argentinense]MDU1350140.1 pyruvate kinase [Clostridium argentinense]
MKKTKIICTIGPTTDDKKIVKTLMQSGMNAARLNFSHGSHEEHKKRIDMVKELREELQKHIAIILDTKGPEIRTHKFSTDVVELKEGTEFTIYCGEEILGDETKCSVTYNNLCEDVKENDIILINDGLVALEIKSVEKNKINTIVKNTGIIGNNKGVNVPNVAINLPSLTEKDVSDLIFGIENEIDIVAASFIRKASDVLDIRNVLSKNGGEDIQIFSKIENRQGVNNIDEIIKFSDGIMVARGDLGVEIPTEEVPVVQKMIIEKCNAAGKPVITATQMLDSMIRNPRPTRAEASDVANAIFDGTDAIMLSGETANGKYPVEVVKTMAQIAITSEKYINYESSLSKSQMSHIPNVSNAISLATCATAKELNASAIITATQSGHTTRQVSKYRPECPIIAVTPYEKVARSLALNWGVYAIQAEKIDSTDELMEKCAEVALEKGYVSKGDLVVMAAGVPANYVGSTNMMKVHIVGDILLKGKGTADVSAFGTAFYAKDAEDAVNNVQEGDILVVKRLSREFLQVLDRVSGIIVEDDEMSTTVVLECTSRDIPIIYNAVDAISIIKTGSFITMDSKRGLVYSGRTNISS